MKKFLLKHHWLAFVLLAFSALAGCATAPKLNPTTTSSVCEALGTPIPFSQDQKKYPDWYAGRKLAVRVHQHNDTGTNLHCKAYK